MYPSSNTLARHLADNLIQSILLEILQYALNMLSAAMKKPLPKRRLKTAARVLSFILIVSHFFQTLEHNTLLKRGQQQLPFPPPQPQFQPTAFHKHIRLRQSSYYVYHNNVTHSSKSTFGAGKNGSHVRISFQLHDRNVVPLNSRSSTRGACALLG